MNVRQVKAARALLGWTQADLAEHAHLGPATVADFEREARTPNSNTVGAIRRAFTAAKVTFVPGGVIVR